MPRTLRSRSTRRKKINVLPTSSTTVTIDKVREYLTRNSATINNQGIVLKKNIDVKKLPSRRGSNRKKVVYCSSYGLYRHKLYKGYFFCHECDMFDQLDKYKKTSERRMARRYQCRVKHSSVLYPTVKFDNFSSYSDIRIYSKKEN